MLILHLETHHTEKQDLSTQGEGCTLLTPGSQRPAGVGGQGEAPSGVTQAFSLLIFDLSSLVCTF